MRISEWSSDVCSSDLHAAVPLPLDLEPPAARPCDLLPGDPTESAGNAGHDEVAGSQGRRGGGRLRPEDAHRSVERHQRPGPQAGGAEPACGPGRWRSEEHTSELQSLMRISYAVFCLKKKKVKNTTENTRQRRQSHTHLHVNT